MTCAFCRRLRSLIFRRPRRCEACEHAMRAVSKHEHAMQDLTRAALDQIDHNAALCGQSESDGDIRTLVEDMLRSLDPVPSDERGHRP